MSAKSSDLTAEDIAEDLLFRTGKALTSDDAEGAVGCFILPQYIQTQLGSRLMETEEEVQAFFANVRAYFRENDVTEVVRTVVSAAFIDEDTVGSTHASRLMRSNGDPFRAPYPVYSILRRDGDTWKIASSSYAILDAPDHNKALTPEPGFDGSDGKDSE